MADDELSEEQAVSIANDLRAFLQVQCESGPFQVSDVLGVCLSVLVDCTLQQGAPVGALHALVDRAAEDGALFDYEPPEHPDPGSEGEDRETCEALAAALASRYYESGSRALNVALGWMVGAALRGGCDPEAIHALVERARVQARGPSKH